MLVFGSCFLINGKAKQVSGEHKKHRPAIHLYQIYNSPEPIIFVLNKSVNCVSGPYDGRKDKPSVLVTSPGSPELHSSSRHRIPHAVNSGVGGRIQVGTNIG